MCMFVTNKKLIARGAAMVGLSHEALMIAFAKTSVPDGMPFFLDERGAYIAIVNRFLRDLPALGCRSPRTWLGYAYDILVFWLFLIEQRGKNNIFDAIFDDIAEFSRRRLSGKNPVSSKTMNRTIAALEKLFEWARDNEIIAAAKTPFRYSKRKFWLGYGRFAIARRNTLYVNVERSSPVSAISLSDFLFFRDVGLAGRLPDGRRDPDFQAQNAVRNVAVANLQLETGMRVTESLALLIDEWPEPDLRSVAKANFDLPSAITKGNVARTIRVPAEVLLEVAHYRNLERVETVERARLDGLYDDPADWLHVERTCDGRLRPIDWNGGQAVHLQKLKPEQRSRLVLCRAGAIVGPLQTFVANGGRPLTSNGLRLAFARASERCGRFGRQIHITPHVLRHTFAVLTLAKLIQNQGIRLSQLQDHTNSLRNETLVHLLFNPLEEIQRRMGHRSIQTTFYYLDHVRDHATEIERSLQRPDRSTGGALRGVRHATIVV